MKHTIIITILFIATSSFAAEVVKQESRVKTGTTGITSKYTSIMGKDCRKVELRMLRGFTNAESAFECPATKGWRLFKVYDRDSERS